MATRLAQHGITTAIMQYSLYPDALMPEMVAQVNAALDYTIHHLAPNIRHPHPHHHHSNNNNNNSNSNSKKKRRKSPCITLLGHSAGAQLCAMALLQRITPTSVSGAIEADFPPSPSSPLTVPQPKSTVMPDRFIGMAGVYDLAQHYEYERSRGLHELSTMKRAAGGAALFDMQSPAVILRQLASSSSSLDQDEDKEGESTVNNSSGVSGGSKRERRNNNNSNNSNNKNASSSSKSSKWHLSSIRGRFPKTTLMCSSDDMIVPAVQSVTLASIMKECGVDGVDVLKYGGDDDEEERGGHGGFVVDWEVKREGERGGYGKVTRYGEDLIKLLSSPPSV